VTGKFKPGRVDASEEEPIHNPDFKHHATTAVAYELSSAKPDFCTQRWNFWLSSAAMASFAALFSRPHS